MNSNVEKQHRLDSLGHGPVEVVPLQRFASLDLGVGPPLVGGPVAAGVEEAMEDGKKDGPLDIELEAASVAELLDDSLAPRLLPEPLEDQGGSDASRGEGRELPLGVSGEQEDGLGQACPRDRVRSQKAVMLQYA